MWSLQEVCCVVVALDDRYLVLIGLHVEDKFIPFHHRSNADGTVESICPDCLRTISKHRSEADLALAEENHICDEVIQKLIQERLGRRKVTLPSECVSHNR
jgi:hypothetical protein